VTQYINLLNPALQKRSDALSARVLFSTGIAAAIVVALAAAWAQYNARDLERQANDGEAVLKRERDNLVAVAKAATERKPSTNLVDELARAEAKLKVHGDLIRLVESGALGKTEGFSDQLLAFARLSTNGLWLTGFSINADGSETEIDGKALSPELLPAYIRRLNSERVFQGRRFSMLDVNRVQEETRPPLAPSVEAGSASSASAQRLPSHIVFSLSAKTRNTESVGRP
jgi:hypothetical protein